MMSTLLLAALAGTGMLWNLEVRAVRHMESRAHASGALFAQWFEAAHHLAQSEDAHYRRLVALHGGIALPADALKNAGLVPAWMPVRSDAGQTMSAGVLDDGRGTPMAFALATPTRPLSPLFLDSFAAGAAANRVGNIAGLGRASRASRWQTEIERVLGRALQAGELYATADVGLTRDRRVLYRREQPGRAGMTQMREPLSFADGAGISDIGELDAQRAEVAEDLEVGTLRTPRSLAAPTASVEGAVRAAHVRGRDIVVGASLEASSLRTDALAARNLLIETELASSDARASGTVAALGVFAADEALEASETRSDVLMSEHIEAWDASSRLEAAGRINAGHSVGGRATFNGRVTVTGWCSGC